jgi:hypothetical protein
MNQASYTFNQRKGDRLVNIFLLSCFGSLGMVMLSIYVLELFD